MPETFLYTHIHYERIQCNREPCEISTGVPFANINHSLVDFCFALFALWLFIVQNIESHYNSSLGKINNKEDTRTHCPRLPIYPRPSLIRTPSKKTPFRRKLKISALHRGILTFVIKSRLFRNGMPLLWDILLQWIIVWLAEPTKSKHANLMWIIFAVRLLWFPCKWQFIPWFNRFRMKFTKYVNKFHIRFKLWPHIYRFEDIELICIFTRDVVSI